MLVTTRTTKEAEEMTHKKLFEIGGSIAAVVLIAFGIGRS